MITISLCMIVKNEAQVLARCLDSVRAAVDEIIIVDTGSTDQTKEIAARYTQNVVSFPWVDDFSAARNFSYDQAVMDYQMWLDADDVLPAEELAHLLSLKKTLSPDIDMVTMKYHTHFDEAGTPVLTSTRERLTRRDKGYRWQDPVHECIPLTGSIYYSPITIWHQKPASEESGPSLRNLKIYEALEAKQQPFTPRQQYYFARELKDHGQFARAIDYFTRFLDGGLGWSEDNIASCFNLAACYQALGRDEAILSALLRSFEYDAPRAEVCSMIGYYYKSKGVYTTALRWFQLAANLEQPDSLGFILQDYWGYIPNVESCVCCWQLGQYEKSLAYNEKAAFYKPDSPAVRQNRALLEPLVAKNALLE